MNVSAFEVFFNDKRAWIYIQGVWLKGSDLVICLLITLMGWKIEKIEIKYIAWSPAQDWKTALQYTKDNIGYLGI